MNFGELRTSFMSVMEQLEIPATPFDFGEAFDSAIHFIVINMPSEVIPEMVRVYTTNINEYTPRQVTLPRDYFNIMSVRLGKERKIIATDPDVLGPPIFLPATIVSQREFTTKAQYSDEPIVSMFNGVLNYNPELPEALEGYVGPVEMTYKRIPSGYIRVYNNYAKGSLIPTLDQDTGNGALFTMETIGKTWADYGMSTDNLNGGNFVFKLSNNVYFGKIDYAWDDDGGVFSGIHLKEDVGVGTIAGGILENSYITENSDIYSGGGTYFENDILSPDLPLSLHRLALDYAIGKYLLSRQPQIASGYIGLVFETFKSFGVNLKVEFGGEER